MTTIHTRGRLGPDPWRDRLRELWRDGPAFWAEARRLPVTGEVPQVPPSRRAAPWPQVLAAATSCAGRCTITATTALSAAHWISGGDPMFVIDARRALRPGWCGRAAVQFLSRRAARVSRDAEDRDRFVVAVALAAWIPTEDDLTWRTAVVEAEAITMGASR